jgi:hypothetical protein
MLKEAGMDYSLHSVWVFWVHDTNGGTEQLHSTHVFEVPDSFSPTLSSSCPNLHL